MRNKRKTRRAIRQVIAALVLTLCLLVMTPLSGGTAWAVDFTRDCSLTVMPSGSEYADDLQRADVVVDLYLVADAVELPTYDFYSYDLKAPYAALTITEDLSNEQWQALALTAAEIALKEDAPQTPIVTGGAAGAPITGLDAGLYLLIARSADLTERKDYVVMPKDENGERHLATMARSHDYEYLFAPELLSLPSKEADSNGRIKMDNPGAWLYDMAVTLKPTQRLRNGSLEIVKTLTSCENTQPATFVFEVEAALEGNTVYQNVVAMNFTAAGKQTLRLDGIPVNAEVKVKEIYSGARYRLTTPAEQTAVIIPLEPVQVSFTNEYDASLSGGSGVINHFSYDETEGWQWTQPSEKSDA